MQVLKTDANFLPSIETAKNAPPTQYLNFTIHIFLKYFDIMCVNIDSASIALIAFCPEDEVREALWKEYGEIAENQGALTGSVHAVGGVISYLTNVLDLKNIDVILPLIEGENKQDDYVASPKNIYFYFLLVLCSKYYSMEDSIPPDDILVDQATAKIIAFCQDEKERNKLWDFYIHTKQKQKVVEASALVVGKFVSYLTRTLDIIETATGGFG